MVTKKISELQQQASPEELDLMLITRDVGGGVLASYAISFNDLLSALEFTEAYIIVVDKEITLETGTGLYTWTVPEMLDGKEIVDVHIAVAEPSTSGDVSIQVRNVTKDVNVLLTQPAIGAGQYNSYASSSAILNGLIDRGDRLRIDLTSAGSGAKGLDVIIRVRML